MRHMPTAEEAANDPVVALWREGLTASEIAKRTGRTTNAILGHIWRRTNGRTVKTRTRREVPQSLRDHVAQYDKHVARYILAVSMGYGFFATARVYGLSHTTVITSCRKVEDMRDDPEFDEWLEREEQNTPGY